MYLLERNVADPGLVALFDGLLEDAHEGAV
jgi:hypothetical protein